MKDNACETAHPIALILQGYCRRSQAFDVAEREPVLAGLQRRGRSHEQRPLLAASAKYEQVFAERSPEIGTYPLLNTVIGVQNMDWMIWRFIERNGILRIAICDSGLGRDTHAK